MPSQWSETCMVSRCQAVPRVPFTYCLTFCLGATIVPESWRKSRCWWELNLLFHIWWLKGGSHRPIGQLQALFLLCYPHPSHAGHQWLIHWWGQGPHDSITSPNPRLWTLLQWGPSLQHTGLWGVLHIQTIIIPVILFVLKGCILAGELFWASPSHI